YFAHLDLQGEPRRTRRPRESTAEEVERFLFGNNRIGAMDAVDGMRVFVRVAQCSGFAAAARELRISPAAVTQHVAALEARVGARLLERTTRRVGLTEAGRVYLERCRECLQAFEDADAGVSALSNAPRGKLRISAPVDLHARLPAVVAAFVRACPEVSVDLRL